MIKIFLICIVFLVACSPSKRIAHIAGRHPEVIKSDTVFRHDTTITKHISTDTSFIFAHSTDTFTVVKEKLSVKIIRDHDTIKVKAEVVPDTIIKEIPVTVNTVTPVKQLHFKWYWWILLFLVFGVMLYTIFKNASRRS